MINTADILTSDFETAAREAIPMTDIEAVRLAVSLKVGHILQIEGMGRTVAAFPGTPVKASTAKMARRLVAPYLEG